jgi:hypothetical protein
MIISGTADTWGLGTSLGLANLHFSLIQWLNESELPCFACLHCLITGCIVSPLRNRWEVVRRFDISFGEAGPPTSLGVRLPGVLCVTLMNPARLFVCSLGRFFPLRILVLAKEAQEFPRKQERSPALSCPSVSEIRAMEKMSTAAWVPICPPGQRGHQEGAEGRNLSVSVWCFP